MLRLTLIFLSFIILFMPVVAQETSTITVTTLPHDGVVTYSNWREDDGWIVTGEMIYIGDEPVPCGGLCLYRVHVWDMTTYEELFSVDFEASLNYDMSESISFNRDRTQMMVFLDFQLWIWDIESEEEIIRMDIDDCRIPYDSLSNCFVSWNADESELVVETRVETYTEDYYASSTYMVTLSRWDAYTGELLSETSTRDLAPFVFISSYRNERIAFFCIIDCETDYQLDVWIVNDWEFAFSLPLTTQPHIDWNNDGSLIATWEGSNLINVWSGQTGELQYTFENTNIENMNIRWSFDYCRLTIYGRGGIRAWDACTGEDIGEFLREGLWVWSIDIMRDNANVVLAMIDHTDGPIMAGEPDTYSLLLWDATDNISLESETFLSANWSWYGFIPNYDNFAYLLTQLDYQNYQLNIWDIGSNQIQTIGEITEAYTFPNPSPTGQYLLVDADTLIQVWDWQEATLMQEVQLPTYYEAPWFSILPQWNRDGSRLLVPVGEELQIWEFE